MGGNKYFHRLILPTETMHYLLSAQVREGDQVVIESVKYPSQCLNASAMFSQDKQLRM